MATWSILVILGRSGLLCPEAEGQRTVTRESKHAVKEVQIPRFARDDGGVDNRDDAAEDDEDDTTVDSIPNNNVMDSGLWRSGIGSPAGFDFANFFEAGAEAHFKTLIGGFVPGTPG